MKHNGIIYGVVIGLITSTIITKMVFLLGTSFFPDALMLIGLTAMAVGLVMSYHLEYERAFSKYLNEKLTEHGIQ